MQNPSFIADVHLGKLARHLRMVGFDTSWSTDPASSEDDILLATSLREHRILLTRDRALHDRAESGLRYYVHAVEPGEQLLEVLKHFKLLERVSSETGFLTRCLECNSPILPVKGHQVHHLLPGSALLEHDEFFFCPRCERVYWKGSHFERMRAWVKKLIAAAAVLLISIHAHAADPAAQKNAAVYNDFIAACTRAFSQSSQARSGESPTPEHLEFGKFLCECTAQESKSQKVSIEHLKKETAKINADPKYKLSDPGLLASLQYCSMKATEGVFPDR